MSSKYIHALFSSSENLEDDLVGEGMMQCSKQGIRPNVRESSILFLFNSRDNIYSHLEILRYVISKVLSDMVLIPFSQHKPDGTPFSFTTSSFPPPWSQGNQAGSPSALGKRSNSWVTGL